MEGSQLDHMRRRIAENLREFDITQTDAWIALSSLASSLEINSIEIFEDEIQVSGADFSGPILWYVTLSYGNVEDPLISSESFPGKFEGYIDDGKPIIASMTADTSSFYE